MKLAIATTLAALLLGAAWLSRPAPAYCAGCIPTFCGTSSECPGACVCAIPMGKATGSCMGTRP